MTVTPINQQIDQIAAQAAQGGLHMRGMSPVDELLAGLAQIFGEFAGQHVAIASMLSDRSVGTMTATLMAADPALTARNAVRKALEILDAIAIEGAEWMAEKKREAELLDTE